MTPDRRSNIWLLAGLIVILLVFVIFEPSYGWKLRQFFTPSNVALQGSDASGSDDNLVAVNESLKAQLAKLQAVAAQLPTSTPNYVRAMVYSRYPLNFKNELIVNVGKSEGIASGSAVVFQGLFIGRVATVWNEYSAVSTVFDDSFKMPVRVGPNGYDGLLTGGSYPLVASIAKGKPVGANDIVYTAAPGIPYALPIGEVMATSTSADNLFEQAALVFPYDINNIQTVLIAK